MFNTIDSITTAKCHSINFKSRLHAADLHFNHVMAPTFPYICLEFWKRDCLQNCLFQTISVGSAFQAAVPEGLCKYGDAPAYENEDRLLWDPSKMEGAEGIASSV